MKENGILRVRKLGFQWETQDPFLFCVHHEDFYPEGNEEMGPASGVEGRPLGQDFTPKDGWRMYHGTKVPGFPVHPHTGFETVTVVRDGFIDHSDSLGGAARFGNGDVQWLTAGKGIQHSEMFPLLNQDKGNRLELFQIWLNLPAKSKQVPPYFRMNWSEEIPLIEEKGCRVEVLAGSLHGQSFFSSNPDSWAADKTNEVGIYLIKMDENSSFELPAIHEESNRSLYFFEGEKLVVNGVEIPSYHAVDMNAGKACRINSQHTSAQILVLEGKPIGEPVVQHGPFVMNSPEEIQEAFRRYRDTEFGGWPWNSDFPVHPKEKRRFARYPDGREVVK